MKHETRNMKTSKKGAVWAESRAEILNVLHFNISIALMILNGMFCEFCFQNAVRNVVLPTHTPMSPVSRPSSLHSFQISKPFLPASASKCLIMISSTAIDVCDHLNDDKGQFILKEGI